MKLNSDVKPVERHTRFYISHPHFFPLRKEQKKAEMLFYTVVANVIINSSKCGRAFTVPANTHTLNHLFLLSNKRNVGKLNMIIYGEFDLV